VDVLFDHFAYGFVDVVSIGDITCSFRQCGILAQEFLCVHIFDCDDPGSQMDFFYDVFEIELVDSHQTADCLEPGGFDRGSSWNLVCKVPIHVLRVVGSVPVRITPLASVGLRFVSRPVAVAMVVCRRTQRRASLAIIYIGVVEIDSCLVFVVLDAIQDLLHISFLSMCLRITSCHSIDHRSIR